MKYRLKRTGQFKKSFKLAVKRGKNPQLLFQAIEILVNEGQLPPKYLPHVLKGTYDGIWECHIEPDWLLLWQQNDQDLLLILTDTGTHSDLFR